MVTSCKLGYVKNKLHKTNLIFCLYKVMSLVEEGNVVYILF